VKFEKGIFLISGDAKITVFSGEVYLIGKKLEVNEQIYIPCGKRIPLEVISDSEIDIKISSEDQIQKLPERTIPPEWDKVTEKIEKEKIRTVLVLGEVDTGKTFFSTYLANRLISLNKKVSVIDLDAGQSDIGPPGTLGLAVLDKPQVFLSEVEPTAIYFLGSHSPGLHFLPSLVGFYKLVKKGLSLSDVVIVDTPGWVQGDGGRALRRSEIELIEPDLVILMQRKNELEHLVKNYPSRKILRLVVSKKASPTSPEERKKLRELLSKKYFRDAKEIEIEFDKIATDRCYLLTGEKIEIPEFLWAEKLSGWEGILVVSEKELKDNEILELKKKLAVNRIKNIVSGEEIGIEVALCDENSEVISLAVIKKIDYKNKKFILHSPIKKEDISRVRIIQFGSLRLTLTGEEAGFVEPGYF